MYRFRKKSESKSVRPQLIEDLFDYTSSPTTPASTSTPISPPALPALSTGPEFRTSVLFPDLTRYFASGRTANVSEAKIRSKLAEQRAHGAGITEEEQELMFSALNSIQGFRRRGNSISSSGDGSLDVQYQESVSTSKSSAGPSLSAFPETPAVQESSSIYPFSSLSSQNSTSSSSSRRLSNNLFGSSRFRDATTVRGASNRNRTLSASTNSQDSTHATLTSSDNEYSIELNGVPEEQSSGSSSPSPLEAITSQPLSDKEKTPTARTSRLPVAPRMSNGNTLSVAQIRRMSVALERAISAIAETEHEPDDEDERILAPHSVPLGGAYPSRRPPTSFNDPSHPIEVADLNAVLQFLAETERARLSGADQAQQTASHSQTHSPTPNSEMIVAPAPVSRTPGYVPGMNRPISPRDMSGHESEDYSTTPRATSPVNPFGRGQGRGHHGNVLTPVRNRQANGSGRPSTAPTRVGMASSGVGSDWQRQDGESVASVLERSLSSGQAYERRYQPGQPNVRDFARARPSSPLAQESTPTAVNGGSFASGAPSSNIATSTSRPTFPNHDEYEHRSPEDNRFPRPNGTQQQPPSSPDIVQGLQRQQSLTHAMTGPTLPDSPHVDEIPFRSYFPPIPAAQTWGQQLERSVAENGHPSGIIMPQPTAHIAPPRTGTPNIVRSQTPNNIARVNVPFVNRTTTPPVARIGTPNYLLQRSPSVNGHNPEQEQNQEMVATRAISPRPARSHTPSNSSASAYNPLMHSSMASSSRSSIESVGSSYHSSDGDSNHKFKEVANWLFDPESKGAIFVSSKKGGASGSSSKGDGDSKGDAISDSIDDQEDVLELLTGLTKKDFMTIQQKLVSAAVAREAEEAIRLSQRRRRPSVQSREMVGSPTPKPIINTNTNINAQPEPTIIQLNSPPHSAIKRVQSPVPEPDVAQVLSEPPLIVPRPMTPVDEPPNDDFVVIGDHLGEFEVESVATPPPPPAVQMEEATPVEQSPRARALAEALFGSAEQLPQARHSPSVEELQQVVEKKALAATVALKNPLLNLEGNPALRRKKIDLQKISGPHLVSASMSVDAIPPASPSVISFSGTSPVDTGKGVSKIGDRLRRLGGSLRHKSAVPVTIAHRREQSSTLPSVREPASASSQVIDYDPRAMQTPQVRSVPPHSGTGFAGSPSKAVTMSSGMTTPPATTGPAGLKGFITRFRQPKTSTTKKDDSGLARPAVSMQQNAFMSSSHLDESDSPGVLSDAKSGSQADISTRSPGQISHALSTPGEDEAAYRELFAAAKKVGLDPSALNELLQRGNPAGGKPTNWGDESRPGTSTQRYEDSSNSSWVMGQLSRTPSRQPSTKVRIEGGARARPAREGAHPISAIVRRTIIYPAPPSTSSVSPSPGQTRGANISRKFSLTGSKRRPMSTQSGYSSKSVHERVPTPPPPRGAAARRVSQDGSAPPVPSTASFNGRPNTSAGIYDTGSSRRSVDISEDQSYHEDGRALQMVELENGEVIWSVLDTLRSPGPDDMDDESRSNYFPSRGSYASQWSGQEAVQATFRGLGRSNSRAGGNGSQKGAGEDVGGETKVVYGDAREIARLIGQITNAADYGNFNVVPGTPASGRSDDLPVEEQLDRLIHKLTG